MPARIVPADRLTDDEFLAFCQANEPDQFEMNERGEILVTTPLGLKGSNIGGYVFRKLDDWVEQTGNGFAVNANGDFVCRIAPCVCQMRHGFLLNDGTLLLNDGTR